MAGRLVNDAIRTEIKKAGFFQYEVCDVLGITEPTLIRWLRKPLPPEKEREIYCAIDKLRRERESA